MVADLWVEAVRHLKSKMVHFLGTGVTWDLWCSVFGIFFAVLGPSTPLCLIVASVVLL